MQIENINFEDGSDMNVIDEVIINDCYRVKNILSKFKMDVLDLGANIGTFSLLCAKNGSCVTAIEPGKGTITSLINNISLNSNSEILVINKGISSNGGQRSLYYIEGYPNSSVTMYPFADREFKSYYMDTICFNEVVLKMQRKNKFSFLKMDIEGAEREIFDICFLRRFDAIAMEWHNYDAMLYKEILKNEFDVRLSGGGPNPCKWNPTIGAGMLFAINRKHYGKDEESIDFVKTFYKSLPNLE